MPSRDVLTFLVPQTPVIFLLQAAGHAPGALLALSFVGSDLWHLKSMKSVAVSGLPVASCQPVVLE